MHSLPFVTGREPSVPEDAQQSLPSLPLGIPVLDREAPLDAGQVHLLEAQGPWESVRCQLVLEAYRRGLPVHQVVVGERIDPCALTRAARRAGLPPGLVLEHSLVASAPTSHQLSSLLHEALPRQVRPPALVMLTDPLDLHVGGEVDARAARLLVRDTLRRFASLIARRGAYGVVVTRPFARRGAAEELLALGGPHVRLSQSHDGLVCDLVRQRRRLVQWTVWPQVRLDVDGLVVLPMESDDERDPLVFEGKSATAGKVGHQKTEVATPGG